jgi:hypothetical protein
MPRDRICIKCSLPPVAFAKRRLRTAKQRL